MMTDDDGRPRKRTAGIAGTPSARRYGADMDAAPLDRRDGTGNGGDGTGSDGDDHQRSWRAATGLIGVLAALIVVLWLLSLTSNDRSDIGGRDADPEDGERFEAPTTSSPLLEVERGIEVAAEAAEPSSAGPPEPFSDLDGRLVYLSGSHVAMVDLATGALQRLPLEPFGSVLLLDGVALLTDGKRTVGVFLAHDPPTAVLITSGAELVPSTEPLAEYWVISRPDGPDGAVWLNAWQRYGVLTGATKAPSGSEVLVVRNTGVLVTPPVGRTFRPKLDGFEVVSEHRLLAASDQLQVEQRCDEDLSCMVVVVDAATGRVTELPEDFVAELAHISVSPDSRWLLNDTSPAWLFDRRSGQVRLLDGGGYGRPLWSGDSTSVAWLTTDRTPALVVAELEPSEGEKGWLVVELAGLNADPSPGSSFLLEASLSQRPSE